MRSNRGVRWASVVTVVLAALAGCDDADQFVVLQPVRSSMDAGCADGFEHESPTGHVRCLVRVGEPHRFPFDRVRSIIASEYIVSIFGREASGVGVSLEVDAPVPFCETHGRFWSASMNGQLLGVDWGNCSSLGIFGGNFRSVAAARETYRDTGLRFDVQRLDSAEPLKADAAIWIEICEQRTLRPDPAKYPVDCDTPHPDQPFPGPE